MSGEQRKGIPIESPESRRKRRMASSHDLLSPINTLDRKPEIKRPSSFNNSTTNLFPLKLDKLPTSYTNRPSFSYSFGSLLTAEKEEQPKNEVNDLETDNEKSTTVRTPTNERRREYFSSSRSESLPSNREHSTPISSRNSPSITPCQKSLKISAFQYRLNVFPPSTTVHYDEIKLSFFLGERFLVLTAKINGENASKLIPFSKILRVQFIRQINSCSSEWMIDFVLAPNFDFDLINCKPSKDQNDQTDQNIEESCNTLRVALTRNCGLSVDSIESILLEIVQDKTAFHFTGIRDHYGEFESSDLCSSPPKQSKQAKPTKSYANSSIRVVPSFDSLTSSESIQMARIRKSPSTSESPDVFDVPRRQSNRLNGGNIEKRTFDGGSFTYVDPDFETERVKLFCYPEGEVDSIQVTSHELERLEPGIWLNDTLIDFELRYLLHQLSPTLIDKVHVFNSFFYRRLSSAKLSTTTEKSGFDLVKSWTKKVNLFEKDFIVIPINENLHWFLAIICHPNRILSDETEDSVSDESEQLTEEDFDIVDLSDSSNDKTKILIFDSLGLTTRGKSTAVINRLRTYLQLEAQDKLGKASSKSQCNGHVVKVPQQENYTDCGCFLLQFVEEFFKGIPQGIVETLSNSSYNLSDWFPSAIGQSRRNVMKDRIKLLAQDYAIRVKHKPEPVESNSSDVEEIVMYVKNEAGNE